MSIPTNGSTAPPLEQRYAEDDQQPESATSERAVLAEREDGTIRGDTLPKDLPGGFPANAVPIIRLTASEQQPIDPDAEYRALSEREDGTNIG